MAIPRLRFKADDGNEFPKWEEKEIGSYLEIRSEKQKPTDDAPLMAFIANIGVADKGNRYDRSFLVKDSKTKTYKRTELNDFIYSSNNLDVGSIGLNTYGSAVISDVYEIFKPKEGIIPKVISYAIQRPRTLSSILQFRQGCLYGQYRIYPEDFLSVRVSLPKSYNEQKKIECCFNALDTIIVDCQSEIDAWEEYKRGVMQQLFSQKVRFKADDGSEYPEWRKRALEECCDTFTDGNWIESKDQSDFGIRLIQTGNIGVTNYLDKPDTKKWISNETFNKLHCIEVFPGDILISRLPDPAGRACIIPDLGTRMITAVDCTIVRTSDECNSNFLVQYLSTSQYFNSVNSFLAGGTRQRISRSNLATITIPYPCLEEQQKIADCLSAFDEVIDKAKQKLEAYKQLKKGLLQQMFV